MKGPFDSPPGSGKRMKARLPITFYRKREHSKVRKKRTGKDRLLVNEEITGGGKGTRRNVSILSN